MVGSLPADSLILASNAAEQKPQDSLSNKKPFFVAPRLAPPRASFRHPPLHFQQALKVLSRACTPGTEELPPSLCTRSARVSGGTFWSSKSRREDPFLQKLLAAKNLNLERLPYRDAYLFQYGLLPDQYMPPREDHEVSIHPCDRIDAKRPESLVHIEANKQNRLTSPAVPAWDGTMKNVTAPLLWRDREPLF